MYAPTYKLKEEIKHISYVKPTFAWLNFVHCIIGGDFNAIFEPTLHKHSDFNCTNIYTGELIVFIESCDLVNAIKIHFT